MDGLTLHRPLASLAFILALICSAAMPAMAQEVTKPIPRSMPEGWHPKDGIYAYRGKDFDVRCRDFGDLSIELARSRIMGYEVSCKVTKRARIAPETLEIGLLCGDLNLAAHLNEPEEREFKEVMLLKKMSEATISVHKTVNGKFADPSAQAIYCPDQAQHKYKEMKRREQEARKAEAAAKKTSEKWIPKDGIYELPAPASTIDARNLTDLPSDWRTGPSPSERINAIFSFARIGNQIRSTWR